MENKYKDALDKLKHIESEHTARTGHPCSDILQELVDKETPVKVEKNSDCLWWHCPKCKVLSNYYSNYCSGCGCKLNWSDE